MYVCMCLLWNKPATQWYMRRTTCGGPIGTATRTTVQAGNDKPIATGTTTTSTPKQLPTSAKNKKPTLNTNHRIQRPNTTTFKTQGDSSLRTIQTQFWALTSSTSQKSRSFVRNSILFWFHVVCRHNGTTIRFHTVVLTEITLSSG